jgi:hypothetical protein
VTPSPARQNRAGGALRIVGGAKVVDDNYLGRPVASPVNVTLRWLSLVCPCRARAKRARHDAEGDQITTCVVQAAPAVALKPKSIRRDVALDALKEAISEHGQRLPETSTIPKGVTRVRLEQWKARWMLRTGYDESRSADTNFAKDKAALLKDSEIAISNPFVWIN